MYNTAYYYFLAQLSYLWTGSSTEWTLLQSVNLNHTVTGLPACTLVNVSVGTVASQGAATVGTVSSYVYTYINRMPLIIVIALGYL